MSNLQINKSWFYSAGTKFGWTKDNLEEKGVGVSMKKLQGFKHTLIDVDREKYYLDNAEGLAFVEKYNSYYEIKGMRLGVISRSLLRKLS